MENTWELKITKNVLKQQKKLPAKINGALELLLYELKVNGFAAKSWPNYGKLKGKKDVYHCHLNKGKPRYVVIWQIVDKKIKIMEVQYVGTHENADYKRL